MAEHGELCYDSGMRSTPTTLLLAVLAAAAPRGAAAAPVPANADRADARRLVFETATPRPGRSNELFAARFEVSPRPGARHAVDFGSFGVPCRLRLNDGYLADFVTPPFAADVTAFLRIGANELTLEFADGASPADAPACDFFETQADFRPATVAGILAAERDSFRLKPSCVVTGVVTYAHPVLRDTAIVADPGAPDAPGLYATGVFPEKPRAEAVGYVRLEEGDLLEIRGEIDPMLVEPGIVASRIVRIGRTALPPPRPGRAAGFADPPHWNVRTRLRGTVRNPRRVRLFDEERDEFDLDDGSDAIRVHGMGAEAVRALNGRLVEIDGVVMPCISSSGTVLFPILETAGDGAARPVGRFGRAAAALRRALRDAGLFLLPPFAAAVLWLLVERRRKRSRDAAIAAERKRIAAELHDTISQYLAGAGLLLRNVRSVESTLPPEQREALSSASGMLDLSRTEIRNAIDNLRNDDLLILRLDRLLELFAQRLRAAGAAEVETDLSPLPSSISPERKADAMAIVQELVANALKHGGASRVRLASAALPGNRFRVAVADDGAPFNAASAEPRPGHFGLVDIRERAERNRFALRSGRARGLQELTIEGEASK